ncbi:MAG TPA: hypothetical protein PKJ16_13530 [Spirochaetota bacterium]|nr:hypothetical protein [Spirochaetota bacterium]HPU90178.1 hypothetical protein [Spirochaetota bacterium]
MAKLNLDQIVQKYPFLERHVAKEPSIGEVLDVILEHQDRSRPEFSLPLATMDVLLTTRAINIPYTTARDRNIGYLVDLLTKTYPEQVRPVATFAFSVDEATKKLSIQETVEYTVMLDREFMDRLVAQRDAASLENLLGLLARFRFFNLTKLIKKAKRKDDLSRIIKMELGKQIFTFKHYDLDKDLLEWAEDHCFHAKNFKAVQESFTLKALREIIAKYSDFVNRRLKKYGILNADFSDYRDSKLDYLFNILIDDIATTMADRDLVEVKNMQSLRKCLQKVETLLDPTQRLGTDIAAHVRDAGLCTEQEIMHAVPEVTHEIVEKWATDETLAAARIVRTAGDDGSVAFINAPKLVSLLVESAGLYARQPENLAQLSHLEKQQVEARARILVSAARAILNSGKNIRELLGADDEEIAQVRSLIADYEDAIKRQVLKKELERKDRRPTRKRSFFQVIIDFFKSLFGARQSGGAPSESDGAPARKKLTRQAVLVYQKTASKNAPILPLSEFIELTPANSDIIDSVIDELRESNTRVVIPIYNARKSLYPKRSQKLLIADVEYLLIPPKTMKSPDSIREYIDSLVGYNLKDEPIPGNTLLTIEKQLLGMYHQKRQMALKKEL